MRTKILLGAAALAASMACSMAQNVYSVNVVGYVNITLPSFQFACVANPLDATMGGTVAGGNNITNLFQGMNDGTFINVWDADLNDYSSTIPTYFDGSGWDTPYDMAPGKAVLLYNAGDDKAVTFVGQVVQGSYAVGTLGSFQFSQVGAPVPIGGSLTNSLDRLGVVPADGDFVQTWDSAANDWTSSTTYFDGTGWDDTAKQIAPAQGFFYYRASDAFAWTSNFTVQ